MRSDAQNDAIQRILDENSGALRRMAQDNGALLAEYRECITRITVRNASGVAIPKEYLTAVSELHDTIVRRMNGDG